MIPRGHYKLRDIDAALHDGAKQQRRPVVDVHVAAILYQQLGDLRALARVLDGEVERRMGPHHRRVHAGAAVDEEAREIGVTLPRRHPQSRVSEIVRRLKVGAARNEHAHGILVAKATRRHERRLDALFLVFAQLVQVELVLGAAVEEDQLEGEHLLLVERQGQGRGTADRRVDGDRVEVEQLTDVVHAAGQHGLVQVVGVRLHHRTAHGRGRGAGKPCKHTRSRVVNDT